MSNNYLGDFTSIGAVWSKYPEGGKPNDFLTVNGVRYTWSVQLNSWITPNQMQERGWGADNVNGDLYIENDLRVGGTVYANNIRHPYKGLFGSLEQLQRYYPNPKPGDFADVGYTSPSTRYACEVKHEWTDTGQEGVDPSVVIADYANPLLISRLAIVDAPIKIDDGEFLLSWSDCKVYFGKCESVFVSAGSVSIATMLGPSHDIGYIVFDHSLKTFNYYQEELLPENKDELLLISILKNKGKNIVFSTSTIVDDVEDPITLVDVLSKYIGKPSDEKKSNGTIYAQIKDLKDKVGEPDSEPLKEGNLFERSKYIQKSLGEKSDEQSSQGSAWAQINKAKIDILVCKLNDGSTITLDNFDGLIYNGEKLTATASSFNGVVLPYIPNIKVSFSQQVSYVCFCEEYPTADLVPVSVLQGSYGFDMGNHENVGYIHITLDSTAKITASSGEKPNYSDLINVTVNYPLEESNYYTLETAINAVPSNKRRIGQQIKFFDGINWQIHQFTSDDVGYYKYTGYWKKIEQYSAIKGVLFTPDSNIDFGIGIYCPILDIFVKENGGYDKLFVYACYKNSTRLYIAVCDESDKVVSSYINTSNPLSEVGIKTISLTQQDGSGVYVDVVVNLDNISNVSGALRGKPEIIQKKYSPITIENFVDKDGKVFSEKVDGEIFALSSEISEYAKIEDVNVPTSSRLTYKIPAYSEGTLVKVEKTSGELSDYKLYKAKGEELADLTLIQNANFGEQYKIILGDGFDYIYVFNPTYVSEPFACEISYGNVRSLAKRVTSVEEKQGVLYGKNIVCFGDSITEFKSTDDNKSYTDYLADILGANITNGGIGGTRLAQRTNPTDNPDSVSRGYAAMDICNVVKAWTSGDWSIVDKGNTYIKENESDDNTAQIDRLKAVSVLDTDIVTIFGGTNDFTGGSKIGEATSTSLGELNGALNEMIRMILEANPKIRIYVFCPIVRYIGERTDDNWSDVVVSSLDGMAGKKLPDVCDIIAENCNTNHIPVYNWYWTLGWNKYNFSAYFIDSDSTHPYKGFKYLAEKIAGFLMANY